MVTAQEIRIALSVICVAAFAVYGFAFFNSAEAHRTIDAQYVERMPTARDLASYDGRLAKASRSGKFAETCARGQISADTEIHVAMQFPAPERTVSTGAPGFARAHVVSGKKPKAIVLDSAKPTLWNVTGTPAAIILTGAATVAEYPEGVPVFAPRFAEGCNLARWIETPSRWIPPQHHAPVAALMGDGVRGTFDSRARAVAKGAFRRDYASWAVKLGSVPFRF